MPCRATQDGQVTVNISDKMWPTGGGNDKSLQYFCYKNPMNSMKRQKYMTPEDEPPKWDAVQSGPGEEWRAITNSPRKNEAGGPKQK